MFGLGLGLGLGVGVKLGVGLRVAGVRARVWVREGKRSGLGEEGRSEGEV